ncbi:major facilitator superfamily domain-containing protein [Circinella umbellata]|nr:major facilitator superfamily domain-containing protein [Circinella umbellata]
MNDEYDKEADQKLARKITMATIPLLSIIQILQFIDKFILNYSAVLGLLEDTKMTSKEFGFSGSFFFIGQIITQLPNQYFLQRFPVSKYFGFMSICWGISVGCTASASNFPQIAALRFLVGFFEGCSLSAVYLIISMFYRRNEQVFWITIMMVFNFVGMACSGLFSYLIGHMDGIANLHAWKWLMIIFGGLTSLWGIIVFIFLPDTPKSRWFRLTEQEKDLMDSRIRENGTVKKNQMNFAHIKEAIKDIRYYCYSIMCFFLTIPAACSTQFSSQLIKSMGFSNLQSVLMNVPIAVTTIMILFISLYIVQRFNQIYYTMVLLTWITMLGILLLCVLPIGPIQLIGIFLSSPAPAAVILEASYINNVIGYTKRIFYLGTLSATYSAGHIIGPIMMGHSSPPHYYSGLISFIVILGIASLFMLIIRRINKRENNKRQKMEEKGELPSLESRREELDLTDGMDLRFRYRL